MVNAWMAEMLFDKDMVAGKLARYHELRKYLLQKTGVTVRYLYEELASTAKTEVGSGGGM